MQSAANVNNADHSAVFHAGPLLQLAIDVLDTASAVSLAEKAYPHFDIAEIGTPLIIEEGLQALQTLKQRFPDKLFLADLKIMDAGRIEAESAFRRGANIVTVLGLADDRTIAGAVEMARKYDGSIMVDLINCPDPVARVRELEAIGVDLVCLHLAYDAQEGDFDPLRTLRQVRNVTGCRLAVAGGLRLPAIRTAVHGGADILVIGGGITTAASPAEAAAQFYREIQEEYQCMSSRNTQK